MKRDKICLVFDKIVHAPLVMLCYRLVEKNKKFELMLTRRAKAYSSFGIVV